MSHSDSIDLLNATHDFPCDFMIKVIGHDEDEFVRRVVESVAKTLGTDEHPPFWTRGTPGGKHVSVTLEPEIQSAEQVLDVYREIRQIDGLVMLI